MARNKKIAAETPEHDTSPTNRYSRILCEIFKRHYKSGADEIHFRRDELTEVAASLKIDLPKNLGDLIYTFRHRAQLPAEIRKYAPAGKHWIIRSGGSAKYVFAAILHDAKITANNLLITTKVPESTPGIISKYALNDEQAVLAKIRYNRLIDLFLGINCYSLQNHMRTQTKKLGQIEIDEVYVGVDRKGVHYIIPVQAKGPRDRIGIVQLEQDFEVCRTKFPGLIARPVAAQLLNDYSIALFELELIEGEIKVSREAHYALVPHEQISSEDLDNYRKILG
jgi:hypothetical protein